MRGTRRRPARQLRYKLAASGGHGWYGEAGEDDHVMEEDGPAVAPAAATDGDAMRLKRIDSFRSSYGVTLSAEEAAEQVPAGAGGLKWHAQVLADSVTP